MMIPTIPTPEELLDKGFSRGKKQADLIRSQKIPKHLKGKRIEERRVVTSCQVIKDKLKSILDAVPEIESMHPFYQDYIDITVGVRLSPSPSLAFQGGVICSLFLAASSARLSMVVLFCSLISVIMIFNLLA